MNNETKIMNEITSNFPSQDGSRIFRNNVGKGWQGKVIQVTKPMTAMPGDIIIRYPRILNAGLCEGSSDLIGWVSRIIKPDMVGKRVAIFTGLEVKIPGKKLEKSQQVFTRIATEGGAICGQVSSSEDVKALLGTI